MAVAAQVGGQGLGLSLGATCDMGARTPFQLSAAGEWRLGADNLGHFWSSQG